jgi:hypothetical protein
LIAFLSLLLHVVVSPFRTKAQLEAEIILLRHQLNVLRRRVPSNPKLAVARPIGLCLALSPVSVDVERCHDYPAADRHPVASDEFLTVLALEVALSGRCGKRGLRAPARCSTVPHGTFSGTGDARILKLSVVRRIRAGQPIPG